jgi:preprotein translocase SecE subunit
VVLPCSKILIHIISEQKKITWSNGKDTINSSFLIALAIISFGLVFYVSDQLFNFFVKLIFDVLR